MQFTLYGKKKDINSQYAEAVIDIVYENEKAQNIGLIQVSKPINEIEQEKEIQLAFKNIIEWIKNNIVDYYYATLIIERLSYVFKYGISTISKEGETLQIISVIKNENNEYNASISFSPKKLIFLSENADERNNSIIKNFVVEQLNIKNTKEHLHSSMEEIEIVSRISDVNDKKIKKIESNSLSLIYRINEEGNIELKSSIKTKNNREESLTEKNNIIKDDIIKTTQIPYADNLIICKTQEEHKSCANKSVIKYKCHYHLSRNTSSLPIRIIPDSTHFNITPEQYINALYNKYSTANQDLTSYEEDYFARIISFDKRKLN